MSQKIKVFKYRAVIWTCAAVLLATALFSMKPLLQTAGVLSMNIQSLIFFPQSEWTDSPENYNISYEEVSLPITEGVQLHGWYLKAENAKKVLFLLHGNAGNISGRLLKAKGWLARGYSVLLLDYRGYGKSTGNIHRDEDLVEDARAGFELLQERGFQAEDIILYGESMGSFPATRLATEYGAAGLILEAPFLSFGKLAPVHYPYIPKFLVRMKLKKFQFDNESHISNIQAPLFLMHGDQDEICPFPMSQSLFELAPEPKEFLRVERGAHGNLRDLLGENFWDKPHQFLSQSHA